MILSVKAINLLCSKSITPLTGEKKTDLKMAKKSFKECHNPEQIAKKNFLTFRKWGMTKEKGGRNEA